MKVNTNHKVVMPQLLLFGTEGAKQHWDIRGGLAQLHPFDYNATTRRFSSIRISVVSTSDKVGEVLRSLGELTRNLSPRRWIYKASLDLPRPGDGARIGLLDPKRVAGYLARDGFDELVLEYRACINKLHSQDEQFDIVVVYAPAEIERMYGTSERDFRASMKAACVELGVKTQILTDSALNPAPYDKCERAWDLSLGLYVKSGGIPWKTEVVQAGVCFIGITFGIQQIDRRQVTLIGLAEVFDRYGDHLGVQLVRDTLPTGDFFSRITEEGLYLTQDKARTLVSDALKYGYSAEKSGAWPDEVIIHKTSPFKDGEVAGMSAAAGNAGLNLVHFQTKTDLRVYLERGGFPPDRGLFWEYDPDKAALLYTTGKVRSYRSDSGVLGDGTTYFGGGSARPVEIRRAYGALELEHLAQQIVSLSMMNWNSTRPANSEPITVAYARKIIPLLKAGVPPDRLPRELSFYI
jgi:hypothetical protein